MHQESTRLNKNSYSNLQYARLTITSDKSFTLLLVLQHSGWLLHYVAHMHAPYLLYTLEQQSQERMGSGRSSELQDLQQQLQQLEAEKQSLATRVGALHACQPEGLGQGRLADLKARHAC